MTQHCKALWVPQRNKKKVRCKLRRYLFEFMWKMEMTFSFNFSMYFCLNITVVVAWPTIMNGPLTHWRFVFEYPLLYTITSKYLIPMKTQKWPVLQFDRPVVSSQSMQNEASVREVTLLWSDRSAADAELHWISLMHSVTHNVSIGASWRIPLYFHLERDATYRINMKPF